MPTSGTKTKKLSIVYHKKNHSFTGLVVYTFFYILLTFYAHLFYSALEDDVLQRAGKDNVSFVFSCNVDGNHAILAP